MLKRYGRAVIDELDTKDQTIMPFLPSELKELESKYRAKAKKLLENMDEPIKVEEGEIHTFNDDASVTITNDIQRMSGEEKKML